MTKASEERLKTVIELFTQYMNSKRLRKTPERYALLEAAYTVGSQFSVDELQSYVSTQIAVSRVTVYNNLELFVKAGLVLKHPSPGLVRYEACFLNRTHHQMQCTVCGKTMVFNDNGINETILNHRFRNFYPANCSVIVYGICSKCRAKQNREKKKLNVNKTEK